MNNPGETLAQLNSDVLRATGDQTVTVGSLEAALLALFPASDAEEWDRTGLLCGDPREKVHGVAIALDATVDAIRSALDAEANVLITHHPAFLDAPDSFAPSDASSGSGSVIWEAIAHGVALMNFHTALDVSPLAARVLPGMLGLDLLGLVLPIDDQGQKGYGQLCSVPAEQGSVNLSQLAARCTSVFGRVPRVWGDPGAVLNRVATCTGSASGLPDECIQKGVDCLVCGEIRYHAALDAAAAGLCLIEVGHDTSELPLCALLAQAVGNAGVSEQNICLLDQSGNWWTPEATRR